MQKNLDVFSSDGRLDYLTPYENFLFALKPKETTRQSVSQTPQNVFYFLNVEMTKPIEERANIV